MIPHPRKGTVPQNIQSFCENGVLSPNLLKIVNRGSHRGCGRDSRSHRGCGRDSRSHRGCGRDSRSHRGCGGCRGFTDDLFDPRFECLPRNDVVVGVVFGFVVVVVVDLLLLFLLVVGLLFVEIEIVVGIELINDELANILYPIACFNVVCLRGKNVVFLDIEMKEITR
jgi:hypothetical protein